MLAVAQTHPNFSGRWVLLTETSPQQLPLARSLTVEQVDVRPVPMLKVRRDGSAVIEGYQIGIIGGVVGGDRQSTRSSTTSTRWRDDQLIIEVEDSYNDRRSNSIEIWELDRDGHLVITRTERHEPPTTPAKSAVGTYRRE
jgi:hypothetical protein